MPEYPWMSEAAGAAKDALGSLIAASPLAIIAVDQEGRVMIWNPAAERLFGWTATEALNRPHPVIGTAMEPEFRRLVGEALQGNAMHGVELRRPRKDGSVIDVSVSQAVLRDGEGRVIGVMGIVEDITERKRTEAILRRQALIFDLLGEAVVLRDPQGVIMDWNRAAERLTGYTRDEVVGKYSGLLRSDENGLSPADVTEAVRRDGHWTGRAPFRRKDGTVRTAEATFVPQLNETGEMVALIGVGRDITEQVQAEERLRASEERYRQLFHESPLPMWVFEEGTFRFLDVNRRAVERYGYSREEFLSMTLRDIRPPEEYSRMVSAFSNLPARLVRHGLFRHRCKDGSELMAEVASQPVPFGGLCSRVTTVVEVTKREQALADLAASREQLRQFAARLQLVREEERTDVAREIHDELGQALTGLRMELVWLRDKLGHAPAFARQSLDDMVQTTGATIEAVRRIGARLRPVVLDDMGLVAAIEWQAREVEARSRLRCRLTLPEAPIDASPDQATALFRILQEALTNVIRHSRARVADISLAVQSDRAILTVRDDGRGIKSEELNDRRALGLLGMRERALACGGAVTIEAMPEGGTRVRAVIPIDGAGGQAGAGMSSMAGMEPER